MAVVMNQIAAAAEAPTSVGGPIRPSQPIRGDVWNRRAPRGEQYGSLGRKKSGCAASKATADWNSSILEHRPRMSSVLPETTPSERATPASASAGRARRPGQGRVPRRWRRRCACWPGRSRREPQSTTTGLVGATSATFATGATAGCNAKLELGITSNFPHTNEQLRPSS